MVGQSLDARANPARIAHDQVDLHAGQRRPVQRASHVYVFQGVELELDQSGRRRTVHLDFAFDLAQQRLFHSLRRRQHLQELSLRLVPGRQIVEQFGEIVSDIVITCHQSEIGIQPRGTRMVVAGADVGIPPEAIRILS